MENDGEFMPKINFAIAFIVSLYLFSDSFAMQNTDDIKQKGIAIQKNNEKICLFKIKLPVGFLCMGWHYSKVSTTVKFILKIIKS